MNDDELRALVRQAVARHLGTSSAPTPAVPASAGTFATPAEARAPVPRPGGAPAHVSHAMYLTLVNPGDACMIEPAVPCNHCGYCKSHGH
jgi:hypothetical protein